MTTVAAVAWAAGIIDGEGCIRVSRNFHNVSRRYNYPATVKVKMTSRAAIFKLRDTLGVGLIYVTPGWRGKNTMWIWHTSTLQTKTALDQVLPYLVVKRDEALVALQLVALGRAKGNKYTGPDRCAAAAKHSLYEQSRALKVRAYSQTDVPAEFKKKKRKKAA